MTGRGLRVGFAAAVLGLAVGLLPAAAAVFEPREFASAEQEARFKRMIAELRCLVCQNQNIADSNAPLAQDLRREVFDMLHDGRSDEEIVDFMVTRYGDFVLYRPPFSALTLALWGGPAVLVILGLVILARAIARQRRAAAQDATPLSAEEQAQLEAMLGRSEERG